MKNPKFRIGCRFEPKMIFIMKSTSSRFFRIAGQAMTFFAILLFPLPGKETAIANPAGGNASYAVNQQQSLQSVPDIRLFIGKNIKYPKEAWDNGIVGIVDLFVSLDNEGKITGIYEKRPSGRGRLIDGIIIVAVKPEGVDRVKYPDHPLFVAECRSVLQSLPLIDIPELRGKTVRMSFSFLLQEKTMQQLPD
jgi:hypothetical protein